MTVRGQLSRRVAAWARRRHGPDPTPLTLRRTRLYLLPTRAGLVYALLLLTMLLGAMNYDNGMGYALTFLLTGLGFVAMHQGHRNLVGLSVQALGAEPVFAGDVARFRFRLRNPDVSTRYEVTVALGRWRSTAVDLPGQGDAEVTVAVPTDRRGVLRLGDFSVRSRHPGHLVRTWSPVHRQQSVTVYPCPAQQPPPPPPSPDQPGGEHRGEADGEEDFAGLRPFHPGDAPRRIAWKAYAREGGLQVKQFTGGERTLPRWLRLEHATGSLEEQLSVMCRWVLDASHEGLVFGLQLPGRTLQPGTGTAHTHRSLAALADHGDAGDNGD